MIGMIRELLRGKDRREETFEHIMEMARHAAREDPSVLCDLVRTLGRPRQWNRVVEVMERERHAQLDEVTPAQLFFEESSPITPDYRTFREVILRSPARRTVDLSRDLVLTGPWERSRLVDLLGSIGGTKFPWKQDPNHRAYVWEPVGICWVHSGFHSIATGMIRGTGTLVVDDVYDISPVYEFLRCDGRSYRRVHDGEVIADVLDVRYAAIFEIGRLLADLGIQCGTRVNE